MIIVFGILHIQPRRGDRACKIQVIPSGLDCVRSVDR